MLRLLSLWSIALLIANIVNSQEELKLTYLKDFKGTLVEFTHRRLSPEEEKAYDSLLKVVLDLKKLHSTERNRALHRLSESPHVRLIEPLANFIRQLRPSRKQWENLVLGQTEVSILASCADIKVIDLLIEFLGHPLRSVRGQALEELQKILKLPKGYRRGELSWVDLEDKKKRKEVVEFLRDWWKKNKGKIPIYWEGVLEEY